jgi:hypothetical protein
MMSDSILALLNSSDPAQRKRGIGAAAKSADRRYLKLLAHIYKTDPDPALRDLAKKAGVYIHKHQAAPSTPQPAPPAPPAADTDDSFTALRGDLLGDDAALDPAPMPPRKPAPAKPAPAAPVMTAGGTFIAGGVNPKQAEIHYNSAFEMHLKGANGRAALELGTAFHLNPAYADDPTAVAFAAELTGKPPEQVAAYIGNPANWKAMTEHLGGVSYLPGELTSGPRQLLVWFAGGVGVIALVMLGVWFAQSELFTETLQRVTDDLLQNFTGGMIFFWW